MSKVIVTGAAGFIGSYLVEALLEQGHSVIGVDNMSVGTKGNIAGALQNRSFKLVKLDLRETIGRELPPDVEVVFHLAADPEVRTGLTNPKSQFENNVRATYNILEYAREAKIKRLHVASSSTVYGEPGVQPTPEDYLPLRPISIYGCSKLMCETMALGYSQTFGLQILVHRPANVVGGRGTHGVLLDFIAKLQSDRKHLQILGDGKQNKSYIHGSDMAHAILTIESKAESLGSYEVFNVGNIDRTSVTRIAELVAEEMGVKPEFSFTGGIEGGRAWKGDVRTVLLDIGKVVSLGWSPTMGSDDSVRLAVSELVRIND